MNFRGFSTERLPQQQIPTVNSGFSFRERSDLAELLFFFQKPSRLINDGNGRRQKSDSTPAGNYNVESQQESDAGVVVFLAAELSTLTGELEFDCLLHGQRARLRAAGSTIRSFSFYRVF